jgi:hypothetical protein
LLWEYSLSIPHILKLILKLPDLLLNWLFCARIQETKPTFRSSSEWVCRKLFHKYLWIRNVLKVIFWDYSNVVI